MTIVTTRMHQTRFLGFPNAVVVLGHGQRVHVGAQPNHATWVLRAAAFAVNQGHHTRFANARVQSVNAAHLQRLNDTGRSVDFFETQFRVGVQVAPESGEFWMKLGDVRKGSTLRQGTLHACSG